MSTRATYGFDQKSNYPRRKHFIYIHYDGYPSGAAVYFYNALMNPSKGNFATVFIRANPHAELTDSHDIHGDTEYKYDITGYGPSAQIEAYHISDKTTCFFSGLLHEFVQNYSKNIDDFKPFKEVNRPYYPSQIMNVVLAEQALKAPLGNLTAWKGKFEDGANWDASVQDAKAILDVFPELKPIEFAYLFK